MLQSRFVRGGKGFWSLLGGVLKHSEGASLGKICFAAAVGVRLRALALSLAYDKDLCITVCLPVAVLQG